MKTIWLGACVVHTPISSVRNSQIRVVQNVFMFARVKSSLERPYYPGNIGAPLRGLVVPEVISSSSIRG
jgi:hypothetical protein